MNIFIMALEPLDTRYTGQWFNHIPQLLQDAMKVNDKLGTIYNVAGEQVASTVTEGAFLNFTATNIWKNTQINKLAEWFSDGTVCPGDKVLFTDAWHPGVIQTKYMSDLMDIPVEIHSIWHAGSYDPHDFLGRKVTNKNWSYNTERAFYEASDFNYFATEFHLSLLERRLYSNIGFDRSKAIISGQPHGKLREQLGSYSGLPKKDMILFPHRVSLEKQPDIFRDLSQQMPDVEFIVCQDKTLTKSEYHELLASAKIVFSANLQETLGISTAIEAPLVGTIPLMPNRLSHAEIFEGYDEFLYPSEWTLDYQTYLSNRDKLVERIRSTLENYETIAGRLANFVDTRWETYGTAGPLVNRLIS